MAFLLDQQEQEKLSIYPDISNHYPKNHFWQYFYVSLQRPIKIKSNKLLKKNLNEKVEDRLELPLECKESYSLMT